VGRRWVSNPVQVKIVYFFTAFRVAVRPNLPPIRFVPGAPSQKPWYHGVRGNLSKCMGIYLNLTFTVLSI